MNERLCLDCGSDLSDKRADAQFCNGTCKKRFQRKEAKRIAAEEGDPSVVWEDQVTAPVVGIPTPPKKPSTSHVVALKQRTKERILGKAEGHSTPLPASSDLPVPDVPPAFDPMVNALHPEKWTDQDRDHWKKVGEETIESLRKQAEHLEDATAGLSTEALPESKRLEMYQNATYEDPTLHPEARENIKRFAKSLGLTFLPVEDSTAINQQAKAVISKVPTCKPESELERLEKSQLKGKKKE
jgi:hypothetical protein